MATANPTKPTTVDSPIQLDKVPRQLKQRNQWVLWRYEKRASGKMAKMPYTLDVKENGRARVRRANVQDPRDYLDWPSVVKAMASNYFAGVGFVLTKDDDFTVVDLDDLDKLSDAMDIVEMLDSYAEVSPSGKGVHVWVRGILPGTRRRGTLPDGRPIEMYSEARYITVTGDVLNDAFIVERTDELFQLYSDAFGHPEELTWDYIFSTKRGKEIRDLFNGNLSIYGDDHSAADLALMNHLAYWTGGQEDIMEEMFNQSKLADRDKWRNRPDYRERTIRKALENVRYTKGPLDTHSAQRMAEQSVAANHAQLSAFEVDDMGNARAVLHVYPDILAYTDTHGWWVYKDGRWTTEQAEATVYLIVSGVIQARREEGIRLGGDLGKAITGFCKNNHHRITSCMSALRHMMAVSHDTFDADPFIINAENGIVDLRTGTLSPHDPRKRQTMLTPEYDPNTDTSDWEAQVLEWVGGNQDMADFLRRAVGYTITGLTREHVMFYLYGPTRSGKSLFLRVVSTVLGKPASMATQFATLTKDRRNDTNGFDLALLKDARMVYATEGEQGSMMNASLVKRITGDDDITAAYKFKDPFIYRPKFKIWLASNFDFASNVDDDAVWARVVPVHFPNSYLGKEDRTLLDKLLAPESRRAVLAWAVQGAMEYFQVGLGVPEKASIDLETMRSNIDFVAQWLRDECITTDLDAWTAGSELYAAYENYCYRNGITPKKRRSWAISMANKGFTKAKGGPSHKRARGFRGVKLAPTPIEL